MDHPVLRSWRLSDANALLAAVAASDDLGRQLGELPQTRADAQRLIRHWTGLESARQFAVSLVPRVRVR